MLAELCQRYWFPLYAFLRRRGYDAATSEDYVQGFFAHLLQGDRLKAADPQRGRFRSFLLTACKNYVANVQRSERAQRRGGGQPLLSLDYRDGETRYVSEPREQWTAERLFERQWALETIETALAQLAARYAERGQSERFEALRPLIAPVEEAPPQAEVAARLGISENAVKVAAHRLRGQFAALLRELVADTLAGPGHRATEASEVDRELAELLSALRGEPAADS